MRYVVIAIVLAFGCNKKKADEPPAPSTAPASAPVAAPVAPPAATYSDMMTAFRDRMCLCSAPPCVEQVRADMKSYAAAHQNDGMSPDDAKAGLELGQQINACAAKASAGSGK